MENIKIEGYSAYRNTGVDWLGEIPEHWCVKKLKFLTNLIGVKISSKDSELDYIGMENIESWTGKYIPSKSETEGLANHFKKGDILFGKLRPYLAKVHLAEIEGICSTEFLVYRGRDTMLNKYLHRLMLSSGFVNLVDSSTYGSKMPRASADFIGNQLVQCPPLPEQTRIATFLDRKTAQIDQAIAQKEGLIELLKERRQILIHNAVTRGLNPNVRMKDSEVEWIDQIPEHWGMADLRRFTVEHRQGYYSEKGYDETGHKVVRITDLLDENIIDISDSPYYSVNEESRRRYELKNGDFLFQRTGSHKKIGVFYSEEPSVYASYLIRFRFSEKINHKFLLCFLNSQAYTVQLNQQIHGGVNPNIHAENIKICKILYPPMDEQIAISTHIESATQKIASAITCKQAEIEKLREYKATLINSVVTGKIKIG